MSLYFSPHGRRGFDREQFVALIERQRGRMQFDFLTLDGRWAVDVVLRFESLRQDFAALCRRLGTTARLDKRNESCHGHYSGYYDPATRDLVGRLCRAEIEAFDYGFDDVQPTHESGVASVTRPLVK